MREAFGDAYDFITFEADLESSESPITLQSPITFFGADFSILFLV